MGTQARDVWIWDPFDRDKFQHPGELPTNDQAAKSFFVDKIFGPRLAKLSRVTLLDRKGASTMVTREDGKNYEVPTSRVLPWYEGLLVLQELEAFGGRVSWFTQDLRGILDQERTKNRRSYILASSIYVEKKLLDCAVTGASYIDQNDKEHKFRRDKLVAKDQPDEEDAKEGFWKIDDIVGYMPPWEAFCNQRCGLYQEFYQVKWDKFQETDFSNVENGCSDLGSTWEPDECLPPHMDGLRLREKQAWAKRKKDQEYKENLAAAEASKAGKRKEPATPNTQVAERPIKLGRFRQDGKPLIRDMFRLSFGHDFVPPNMDDGSDTIRVGWPKRAEEYPPGFGVADPPGFCHAKCDCMDDGRPQKQWETSKTWLEDPQRTTDALKVIENFLAQTRLVRRRGQVSKQCYLESLQNHQAFADDTQCKSALYLAKEVENQIQRALKDLPLSALMDVKDKVRIPALAFMKPNEDYVPVCFQVSPDSTGRSWAKIGSEDGVLSTVMEPPSSKAPIRLELHHPEALAAVVECLVTTSPKPVWQSGTDSVIKCLFDVTKCKLSRNSRIILQERMSKIYDFVENKVVQDVRFGAWLSCMELTLRLLRSMAFANVVKSEVTSRPPLRAAVARAY